MFLRALAALAALLLVSCGSTQLSLPSMPSLPSLPGLTPHRIEIQQGNFVSQEMVSLLKPGMSKDQVRFILGTALITDSFHADRWDYVFRRQKANSKELEHRRLAVFFEGGKLARTESDLIPASSADVAAVKVPEERSEAPAPKPATPAAKPETAAAKAETPVARQDAPAPKPALPAAKLKVPTAKSETPAANLQASAPKPEAPAAKLQASAPKPETPAARLEAPMLKREAPAARPEAYRQPSSGAESEKSAAAPGTSADKQPQDKRGWWERLKDTVKF